MKTTSVMQHGTLESSLVLIVVLEFITKQM